MINNQLHGCHQQYVYEMAISWIVEEIFYMYICENENNGISAAKLREREEMAKESRKKASRNSGGENEINGNISIKERENKAYQEIDKQAK